MGADYRVIYKTFIFMSTSFELERKFLFQKLKRPLRTALKYYFKDMFIIFFRNARGA